MTVSTSSSVSNSPTSADLPPWAGILSAPQSPDEIGRLGPYRILGHLGAGGMGMVLKAEDVNLKRLVALKVMLPEYAANPTAKARFLREARAAAKVEHDHIVRIFQVGEDHNTAYLAMPLLKGNSLSDLLKSTQGSLPIFQQVRIGREIAEGLAAAHDANLIHRDIKPANIWLEGSRQRVRILDFGLARVEADDGVDDASLTTEGSIVGTPSYMSPEQARTLPLDGRSDLFSLGIVLYQMATGRLPFESPSRMGILMAIATENPLAPAAINPQIPKPLNDLILSMLNKRREDRPATAHEVARRLADIEVALTVVPMVDAPAPVSEVSAPNIFADIDSTEIRPAPVRNRPAALRKPFPVTYILALFALILLLAGGIGIWMAARPSNGILAIEADDPTIDVIVKKDGKIVRERTRDREIELPEGDYIVETSDGRTASPGRVTIAKNGRATVRVMAAATAKKPDDAARFDPTFFNGKDLTGWMSRGGHWKVVDGAIVGSSPEGVAPVGSLLQSARAYTDFEVRFKVRLKDGIGNSGFYFRIQPNKHVQCDLGRGCWGSLWNTGWNDIPKGFAVVADPDTIAKAIKAADGFQEVSVRCVGKHLTFKLNGWVTLDGDFGAPIEAPVGCELYLGTKEVTFKDIRFIDLSPSEPSALDSPIAVPGLVPPFVPGPSPLDKLDAAQIPASERFPWQPKELVAVVGTHLRRHWGGVHRVVVDPTGRKIATRGYDGIRLWDAKKRLPAGTIFGVGEYAFLADGVHLVAVGGKLDGLRLFDVSGAEPQSIPWPHKELVLIPDEADVYSLECSKNGKLLFARTTKGTRVWDIIAGAPKLRKVVLADIHALSESGSRFAYIDAAASKVIVAELNGDKVVEHTTVALEKPPTQSTDIALSPEGEKLGLLEAGNGRVLVFDISGRTARQTGVIKEGAGKHIAFSPDGKRLGRGYTEVELFDMTGPEPRSSGRIPGIATECAFAFTADGNGLVHGAGTVGFVRFWDISGPQPNELDPLDLASAPMPLQFSQYGNGRPALTANGLLAAQRNDNQCQFWNLTGPSPKPTPDEKRAVVPFVKPVSAPTGSRIIGNGDPNGDGTVCLDWQPDGYREVARAPLGFNSARLARGGSILYRLTRGTIETWDLSRPEQPVSAVRGLEGIGGDCIEVSPTGNLLVIQFKGQSWHLFDVSGPKAVKRGELSGNDRDSVYCAAFSPDGTLVVTTGVAFATVYDLKGKSPTVVATAEWRQFPSAAFHPDGKRLLLANSQGQVAIWDWKTQRIEREWKLPGAVPYAHFSADGRHILTHNSNGTVYVLRLEPPPADGAGGKKE